MAWILLSKSFMRKSAHYLFLMALMGAALSACGPTYQGYEVYTGQITIHYASPEVIQKKYQDQQNMKARLGLAQPVAPGTIIRGFFDTNTNELWCPGSTSAQDFETCGHELHHWVDKQAGRPNFHPQPDENRNNRVTSANR
jgi:hypothetical protein